MKIFYRSSYKQGFTLIELLVVVLIIGILAAIALPLYNKSVEKSRLSEAKIIISNLKRSIAMCTLIYAPPWSAEYVDNCASPKQLDSAEIQGTEKTSGCMAGNRCIETQYWQYSVGSQIYVKRLPNQYYLAYNYYNPNMKEPPVYCNDLTSGSCAKICGSNGCALE